PGKMTFLGSDPQHLTRIRLDGVRVDSYDPKLVRAANARITIGPGGSNIVPTGQNVVIEGKPGNAEAPDCTGHFVPFPEVNSTKADAPNRSTVTVAADGAGDYKSIQEAINALPET